MLFNIGDGFASIKISIWIQMMECFVYMPEQALLFLLLFIVLAAKIISAKFFPVRSFGKRPRRKGEGAQGNHFHLCSSGRQRAFKHLQILGALVTRDEISSVFATTA